MTLTPPPRCVARAGASTARWDILADLPKHRLRHEGTNAFSRTAAAETRRRFGDVLDGELPAKGAIRFVKLISPAACVREKVLSVRGSICARAAAPPALSTRWLRRRSLCVFSAATRAGRKRVHHARRRRDAARAGGVCDGHTRAVLRPWRHAGRVCGREPAAWRRAGRVHVRCLCLRACFVTRCVTGADVCACNNAHPAAAA